jgi:ketosteroid isomerase-like protein
MRSSPCLSLAVVVALLLPAAGFAQRQNDTAAINRLIDQYGAFDDAMDMAGQAKLMSADRVWIGAGTGRRTDQATNMRIQQADFDALKRQVPGIQTFTEDRDRLIRFYANGAVAIASFYRYVTVILPPNVPADVAKELSAPIPPEAATLVLERRDGEWKIVHSHFSALTR